MPVSKKRKKDGKPVRRSAPAPEAAAEPVPGQVAEAVAPKKVGRPVNPFVAALQAQARRASQRGR